MDNLTLFDIETLPTKAGIDKPQPKTRYYVYKDVDGKRWVFWKGHDTGRGEWYAVEDHPRRIPHLYKTQLGAKNKAHDCAKGVTWGVWEGKKS